MNIFDKMLGRNSVGKQAEINDNARQNDDDIESGLKAAFARHAESVKAFESDVTIVVRGLLNANRELRSRKNERSSQ